MNDYCLGKFTFGFSKIGKFLDNLNKYQFLKDDCAVVSVDYYTLSNMPSFLLLFST
jgi:hypothetical protein